jgi:hypothetical protein
MAIRGNITDADLTGPLKGKSFVELISTMKNGDAYVTRELILYYLIVNDLEIQ